MSRMLSQALGIQFLSHFQSFLFPEGKAAHTLGEMPGKGCRWLELGVHSLFRADKGFLVGGHW